MKRTIKIPLLLTILLFVGCGSGANGDDGEQISNAVDNQTEKITEAIQENNTSEVVNSINNQTNAIIEQTQVLEEQNISIINNIEDSETIIINDDENITNNFTLNESINISITSKELSAYGEGTFENPFLMLNSNYKVDTGHVWFITPYLNNDNCTIRIRSKVEISNIYIEDDKLLPVTYNSFNDYIFDFDLNSSNYLSVEFDVLNAGYLTIISECLDKPKLFNFDYTSN